MSLLSNRPPSIKKVYHVGAMLTLFRPQRLPDKPQQHIATQGAIPTWPTLYASEEEHETTWERPIEACYAHDVAYTPPAVGSITLERRLAGGARDEHAAQVWCVQSDISSVPLVARMYDPLYYPSIDDRFKEIERAVAIENETYTLLQDLQGSHLPVLSGIFVAEISDTARPRHFYVVLAEWVPGHDLLNLLKQHDPKGDKSCHGHKAAFIDCAARLVLDSFARGVLPNDLHPRNLVLDVPEQASNENFCDWEECPWRNKLLIDIESPSAFPNHPYSLRARMIDLEHVNFFKFPAERQNVLYSRHWVACLWKAPWLTQEARDILGRWTPPTES
ncbi:hypothetical protein R3P38DRAFT_3165994 [Favolaschia claudopus]|uniref:Protein kinase domain-containing protein n=1 Tax=Favolaschia claudopus TaxID=2862362 RepID=A0AAW0EHQ3_9AGAR